MIEEPTGFTGGDTTIYNMQDMTNAICTAAKIGESGRLRDTRDKKIYWVTKLADSNCWMTQNLDLDLNTDITLTSNDSDVTTNWTPVESTKDTPNDWGNDDMAIKSYDPGMYIYTNPTTRLSSGCGKLNSTACKDAGWKNVQNMASSNDPNFAETFLSSGEDVYNAHYLVGNYYSFNAATAGKGATVTAGGSSVENDSICPKNWRLPLSNMKYNETTGSFYYLLDKYGVTSSLSNDNNDIRLAPLYFIYGGTVSNLGRLSEAGSNGYYWSSVTTNGTFAYFLAINETVHPFTGNGSFWGNSVRCVAR